MKRFPFITLSETGLVALVDIILTASEEDPVIKIEFEPKDYVAFCTRKADPRKIEALDSTYLSFSSNVASSCCYDQLCSEMLRFRGRSPHRIEKYNTGSIIYRFSIEH